jgi:hypothetical protein
MNGRVYDYNLGRFLSVDPFIQSPGNSQSMNPYSYIMNNPLAGTDPTGYTSEAEKPKPRARESMVTGSRLKRGGSQGITPGQTSGSTVTGVGGSTVTYNGSFKGSYNSFNGSGGSEAGGDANDIGSQKVRDAQVSNHVYNGEGELPDGVSVASKDDPVRQKVSGLQFNDDTGNGGSGFKSELYYDSNSENYIYAFAGTNEISGDVLTNFAQGIGEFSTQYHLALNNTKFIRAAVESVGSKLSLTGHSLGGGLASMAAALTGLSANTYNAAGVHIKTLAKYSGGMANAYKLAQNANVNAYHVLGELVTSLQTTNSFSPAFPSAIGRPIGLVHPNFFLNFLPFTGGKLHSMDSVLKSINNVVPNLNRRR